MTLSCPFSRHIVNIDKSEYPETIAKYGKKKPEKLANFPVMLSVLITVRETGLRFRTKTT